MKTYIVKCTSKRPAYDETPGTFAIYSKNAAEAVKEARRMMARTGRSRIDGPVSYRAYLASHA